MPSVHIVLNMAPTSSDPSRICEIVVSTVSTGVQVRIRLPCGLPTHEADPRNPTYIPLEVQNGFSLLISDIQLRDSSSSPSARSRRPTVGRSSVSGPSTTSPQHLVRGSYLPQAEGRSGDIGVIQSYPIAPVAVVTPMLIRPWFPLHDVVERRTRPCAHWRRDECQCINAALVPQTLCGRCREYGNCRPA